MKLSAASLPRQLLSAGFNRPPCRFCFPRRERKREIFEISNRLSMVSLDCMIFSRRSVRGINEKRFNWEFFRMPRDFDESASWTVALSLKYSPCFSCFILGRKKSNLGQRELDFGMPYFVPYYFNNLSLQSIFYPTCSILLFLSFPSFLSSHSFHHLSL